ncbi:MAG: RnfABCDGE type electron transport complex subunit B [Lachnospiraceae bacterium]|jgi:Na+-translocating ferredoxin:NAD+ oxidoreductase RNF subunit RnfB|nr:RnfABCDGE type electron transport complex subunit B [Lachnospiraceae bacterium]
MDVTAIVAAAAVIGITGLLIGLLLGIAGKKFAVEVDEREAKVRELLPGNNCGGCGYAGCDAMAQAIAKGEAPANGCPVASESASKAIAAVMGEEAGETEKQVAFVKCNGTCDKANVKYNYYGIQDCKKAAVAPGKGGKACSYGCMGLGSCVKACPFDAIHIVDGVAKVDKEKCKACKKCIAACPNHLIELVPYNSLVKVACNSKDKGPVVKKNCDTGCVGCKICEKQCNFDAIQVEDNLAKIDYSKCKNCGLCAMKCPSKIILKEEKNKNA